MRISAAIAGHAMILPGNFEWKDLRDGHSAIELLDPEFSVPVGARVPLEIVPGADWRGGYFPRALGLALAALDKLDFDPSLTYGLILGLPSLNSETDYLEHCLLQPGDADPAALHPLRGFSLNFPLETVARRIPHCGPRLRVDAACATGNDALILAHQWIEAGLVEDVLVVAASAMLNPIGVALFHHLNALCTLRDLSASCPFDARRCGFVMGEGAAAVWLARQPRGSAPRGYLCGYGQSMNGTHFIDLPEDPATMLDACRQALGGLNRVAYVSAHGTATRINDLRETKIHRELFGSAADEIPISSIKSMIGHCLGAASLIEAIVCVEALAEQIAPPTQHLTVPDPECDLNYVPLTAQPIRGNFALSNAFAFGGQNSCLLFSGTKA